MVSAASQWRLPRPVLERCVTLVDRGFIAVQVAAAAPVASSESSTGSGPCRAPCSSTSTEPAPAAVPLRSLKTVLAGLRMAMLAARATHNHGIMTAAPHMSRSVDHRMRFHLCTTFQRSSHRPMPVRMHRTTTTRRLAATPGHAAAIGGGGGRGCRYAHMPRADMPPSEHAAECVQLRAIA